MSELKFVIFSENHYQAMPWKNGLGSTQQIIIEPPSAKVTENNFIWRLSSAAIKSEDTFSEFIGYDRLLAVYQGDGVLLNDVILDPFVAYGFKGETKIKCQPLSKDVLDLGLIYRRDAVRAEMKIKKLYPQQIFIQNITEGIHFIFCAQGFLRCQGQKLNYKDTLQITGAGDLQIQATDSAIFFHLHISPNRL